MKKFLILVLASLPILCSAAGKSASATMQVSFTVVEACTVSATGGAATVDCLHQTPFAIQAKPAATPAPANAAPAGEPLTVYF